MFGTCPEIDELIATRLIDASGYNGFEQFQELHPRIRERYGDPVTSPIYARAKEKMRQRGVDDRGPLREIFETDW